LTRIAAIATSSSVQSSHLEPLPSCPSGAYRLKVRLRFKPAPGSFPAVFRRYYAAWYEARAMSKVDRVKERRRAVMVARYYREREGLTVGEIAERLRRSPGTVRGYFYDPNGEKARRRKARYRGVCRGCGGPTAARLGKGDTYEYCKLCRPGRPRQWTRERVREAMRTWLERYGSRPSYDDWSRTRARRRGGQALARLSEGNWPAPGTVTDVYGTWAAARADAFPRAAGDVDVDSA
jgi:hypothetical protein